MELIIEVQDLWTSFFFPLNISFGPFCSKIDLFFNFSHYSPLSSPIFIIIN